MNSVIRFSPTNDVRRLQREMDRIFDTFLTPNGDDDSSVWSPRVDLAESEDAYHIHVEIPGVPKENIDINYHNNALTISGERTASTESEGQKFVRIERSYGRFFRSFSLPKAADTEQIQADYEHGVLHVRVPKAEDRKPRRIEIQ